MPEKKAVPTFDAIMRDLKDGHYAPIYLLMGDESYYIDKISDYIQQHVLKPEQQAFDQTVVFGADVNGSMIADLAMQYPMMSPQKVIIVKEAQAMRSYDKLEIRSQATAQNHSRTLLQEWNDGQKIEVLQCRDQERTRV